MLTAKGRAGGDVFTAAAAIGFVDERGAAGAPQHPSPPSMGTGIWEGPFYLVEVSLRSDEACIWKNKHLK